MKNTIIANLLLFLLPAALMPSGLAQDSEEPCSARETVYPRVKTAILDEASSQGLRVRYAYPWERLDIIGSRQFGPWCWLQVSDGWLIESVRALSSEPPDPATVATGAAGGSCYRAEKAYLTGSMNIRQSSTTRSAVSAFARAGESFAVMESRRGASWCWLKISKGWLANTSRVQATPPARLPATADTRPVTSRAANVDNCCFVDRQCESEQQWVDGYYAYRRNECVAQPQAGMTGAAKRRPRA